MRQGQSTGGCGHDNLCVASAPARPRRQAETAGSALARFEAALPFYDDVKPAPAPNHPIIAVAPLQGLNGILTFMLCLRFVVRPSRLATGVSAETKRASGITGKRVLSAFCPITSSFRS